MKAPIARAVLLTGCMIFAVNSATIFAADAEAPGDDTLARVNGEPITFDDLLEQIGSMHMGIEMPAERVGKPDPAGMLDRLIDAKLIVQEARGIGLDELPEYERRIDLLRREKLRTALAERAVAGITEGDPKTIDGLFRDAVREFEIDSLYFPDEGTARRFAEELAAGGDYEKLARAAIAAGASGGGGARSIKASELRSDVAAVVQKMKPGDISPPVPIGAGATIIKLLGVRYPENAAERERAKQVGLQLRQQAVLQETMARWREEYTEVDRELLDSLDYSGGATQLQKLRADERIVARVKGGDPVTVKDLTAGVEKKFFHGVERASEAEKVKPELLGILDRILMERVAEVEADRLGIESSEAFRSALQRSESRILFEIFVQRVVNPEVKLSEDELKRYYEKHISDYLSQDMIRIESLAFVRREDGQAALEKLRSGADLGWMRDNAAGQADRSSFEEVLVLDGRVLLTESLPDGIRAAVAGAKKGEYRFYQAPQGPAYVLLVQEVIPAQASPYDSVKTSISETVYTRKRQEVLEEWTTKLRAASEIEILAAEDQLRERLGLSFAEGSAGEGS